MDKKLTPLELARQTLIQLSKSQSPPTPENYRRVYDEIAGIKSVDSVDVLGKSLEKVLTELGKDRPKYLATSQKIATFIKKRDAENLEDQLRKLMPTSANEADGVNWPTLLRYLLKQLDVNHTGTTLSRKKEGLNRVIINFSNDPSQLGEKIQALITSWGDGQPSASTNSATALQAESTLIVEVVSATQTNVALAESEQALTTAWRDLLTRAIKLVVLPQFADIPAASDKIENVIQLAQKANTVEEINALGETLKSVSYTHLDVYKRQTHA